MFCAPITMAELRLRLFAREYRALAAQRWAAREMLASVLQPLASEMPAGFSRQKRCRARTRLRANTAGHSSTGFIAAAGRALVLFSKLTSRLTRDARGFGRSQFTDAPPYYGSAPDLRRRRQLSPHGGQKAPSQHQEPHTFYFRPQASSSTRMAPAPGTRAARRRSSAS